MTSISQLLPPIPRRQRQVISEERRMELRKAGYRVEDMGAEYGPSFEGQWRFINIVTGDFQDHDTSTSEDDAWQEADDFARCLEQEAQS
jgi:hypothetical protein